MIRTYRLRSLARVSSSLRSRSQNIRNADSVDQNQKNSNFSFSRRNCHRNFSRSRGTFSLSNKNKEEEDVFLVGSHASFGTRRRRLRSLALLSLN